jgi:putative sigma-54 modulation protein
MEIIVKTRNVEINESLRNYVENKVGKLDRYLPNIDYATVELAVRNSRSVQDRHVAQITLRSTNGAFLRAEECSADMYASVDAALDKMSRQIERYKGKHWQSFDRPQQEALPEELETEDGGEAQLVRTKTFTTRPMSVEEAIEQMELLGHDFFAFYDATSSSFSVIYRRRDAGYGLLIPELV